MSSCNTWWDWKSPSYAGESLHNGSIAEVAFGEQGKALPSEGVYARFVIVDVNGQSGSTLGTDKQRIGIVDIDLRRQQCLADLQKGLRSFWQLNHEQIAFRDWEFRLLQNLKGPFRV